MGTDTTSGPSVARKAFEHAVAEWNANNLPGYLDLYDERIALHGYAPEPMGRAEVRGFYEGIFAAFSDIELQIHEIVEDGNQLGCRFTMFATHTADFAGIPPTGRRISQAGFTILVFDGERVVERYSVADFGGVVAQLTA